MNLGHSCFFGVSAYIFGITYARGIPFPWAWMAGMGCSAAFAAAIRVPLLRLRGAYFAVASFGLITLLALLAYNLGDLTGGAAGLSLPPGDRLLPAYYLNLAVAAGSMALAALVGRSRLGLAPMSPREDEEAAAVFGVHAFRYKALALVLSAIPPGLSGGVYTWQLSYIIPSCSVWRSASSRLSWPCWAAWGTSGAQCSAPSSSPSLRNSCEPRCPPCI